MKKNQEKPAVHVMLGYPPLGLVRATAQAIDLDGMTVDTGIVSLARFSEVEVTFSFRRENRTQVHKLGARVAAAGRDGAKLTFAPYGPDTYKLLQEVMHTH